MSSPEKKFAPIKSRLFAELSWAEKVEFFIYKPFMGLCAVFVLWGFTQALVANQDSFQITPVFYLLAVTVVVLDYLYEFLLVSKVERFTTRHGRTLDRDHALGFLQTDLAREYEVKLVVNGALVARKSTRGGTLVFEIAALDDALVYTSICTSSIISAIFLRRDAGFEVARAMRSEGLFSVD